MRGPGKYDPELTAALEAAGSNSGVLLIVGGDRGHGFAVQGPEPMLARLPAMLRHIADAVEQDLYPSLQDTMERPLPGGEM